MKERSAGMTGVKVRFAGRDYDLVRGNWPNGSAALLLVNPGTGRALPASLDVGLIPRRANEVFVPDVDGMVAALEQAGVAKPTSVIGRWRGINVRTCELIHPQLVRPGAQTPQIGYVWRDGYGPGHEQKGGRER